MRNHQKVDARKQRDPSQRSVLPEVSTRSGLDERPVPQQIPIRQTSEEGASQYTSFLDDTAVYSCSICGKRFCIANELRCVFKLTYVLS
jgi:hypothetical protein